MTKQIRIITRFQIQSTEENVIILQVPVSQEGISLISQNAIKVFKLSDKEIDSAETAILNDITIIK